LVFISRNAATKHSERFMPKRIRTHTCRHATELKTRIAQRKAEERENHNEPSGGKTQPYILLQCKTAAALLLKGKE